MSFYTCNRTGNIPGLITGNPLNGICEKACIQTNKVLDACMKQLQETNLQLALTDQTPADPVLPLTFVSATTATGTTITNLVVDRLIDRPNFARVSGSVNIPLVVTYTDANGTAGEGNTTINVPFDVIMFIPQPSVVPYTIEAFGAASVPSGVYVSDSTFSISACITLIIRVIVRAELLVPSYGYCQAPACQEFTQEVCSGVLELPIYPTAIQN